MTGVFTKAALFATMAFALVSGASAQDTNWDAIIAEWADQRGELVTPAAQKAALKAFSDDFMAKASVLRIAPDATANIAKAMTGDGYVTVKPHGVVVVAFGSDGERTFTFTEPGQFDAVVKALEPKLLFAQLVEFPLVKVLVDPVPPVDYIVEINGERVQAREKGEYRVDIGETTVRVTRPPHPDCSWKGTLPAGAEQEVACKL
ncbi:hypothetical protein NKI34_10380 [Mesorhizobium sp. M0700]|uniref:hypothetical protein n=1 Tax=Mesorhizobium sp. M0700 TaxID=2956988 RepID=UPI00333B039B